MSKTPPGRELPDALAAVRRHVLEEAEDPPDRLPLLGVVDRALELLELSSVLLDGHRPRVRRGVAVGHGPQSVDGWKNVPPGTNRARRRPAAALMFDDGPTVVPDAR